MNLERFVTVENTVILMVGMVLGASAITWGLTEQSQLPSEDVVGKYALEKYREDVVARSRYVNGASLVSVEDTNYPSIYNVTLKTIRGNSNIEVMNIYVTKDGLYTLGSPIRNKFPREYPMDSFGGVTAGDYVEN